MMQAVSCSGLTVYFDRNSGIRSSGTTVHFRKNKQDMVNDNHRDFVKAIISIEKGINDERDLDKLYDTYMDNDSLNLLNEEFDHMIEELRK